MENIITVKSEEVVKAVEKISLAGGSTIIFALAKKNKQSGDKNFLNIKSSNGTVQVETNVLVQVEVEPENIDDFVLPSSFSTVVRTIAKAEEEIIFEIKDNMVTVKSGAAIVPIATVDRKKAVCIQNSNPAEHTCFGAVVENELLQATVSRVGVTCITSDTATQFGDSILLLPAGSKDDAAFQFVTADGGFTMATGVKLAIEVKSGELFDEMVGDNTVLSVSGAFFSKIVKQFTGDSTAWFVFRNQIVISNGVDFYTLTLKKFAISLKKCCEFLFGDVSKAFEIKAKGKECITALEIAALNKSGNDARGVVIELSEKGLEFTSIDSENRAKVLEAETKGSLHTGIRKDRLIRIISGCGETISISGMDNESPIYVSDSMACARTLLLPICIQSDADAEVQEEETVADSE